MSKYMHEEAVVMRGRLWEAIVVDEAHECVDTVISIFREVLDEMADSFETDARSRAESPEGVGIRQAEAAATYIRIIRDSKFPRK